MATDERVQHESERVIEMLATRSLGCPACGYDLRGLRDVVCPECGRKVTMRDFTRRESRRRATARRIVRGALVASLIVAGLMLIDAMRVMNGVRRGAFSPGGGRVFVAVAAAVLALGVSAVSHRRIDRVNEDGVFAVGAVCWWLIVVALGAYWMPW